MFQAHPTILPSEPLNLNGLSRDFYNHYSSIMTILTELESVKWTKLNIYFKHIHTSFLVLAEKGKNGPEK